MLHAACRVLHMAQAVVWWMQEKEDAELGIAVYMRHRATTLTLHMLHLLLKDITHLALLSLLDSGEGGNL